MFNSVSGDSGAIANQLFQFAAQNNAANIDWAQLAQQWIAQNSAATTPPPPNISGFQNNGKRTKFEEQGEADMEMDDNEELPPAPPMLVRTEADSQSTGWFVQPSVNMDAWNNWPNATNVASKTANPTAHIPSLMKITVPNPNELSKNLNTLNSGSGSGGSSIANISATIDAAKRKVLPAWIREGLEKMEREKQKREREQQNSKKHDSIFSDIGLNMVKSKFQASDHDDDDSTDNELVVGDKRLQKISIETYTKPINDDDQDDDDDLSGDAVEARSAPDDFGKSYEQKLTELMVAVRRTLTELLLEVTNDEIGHIAHETLTSRKLKGLAAYSSSGESDNDSDNSTASDGGANRRRVGNSNTTSEDSEEEIKSKLRLRRRTFAKVSEEIEEHVAANAAREEQKLKYYKEKEQQQNLDKHDSEKEEHIGVTEKGFSLLHQQQQKGKKYARDFGETTSDSKLQSSSNGKRAKERGVGGVVVGSRRTERTTRFSDNKDPKNFSAVPASYITQLTAGATSNTATPIITPNTIPPYPIAAASSKSGSAHLPDAMAKLQNLYTPASTATSAGISTMMNAADAVLEKATAKVKSITSLSSTRRRHDNEDDNEDGNRRDSGKKRRRERVRERDERHSRHSREHERRHHRTRHTSRGRRRNTSDESTTNSRDSSSDSSNTSSHSSRHSKYSRTSSKSYSRQSNKHSSSNSRRRRRDTHDDKRTFASTASSSSSRHSRYDRESSRHRNRSRSRSRSRSTYSSSSTKRHRH